MTRRAGSRAWKIGVVLTTSSILLALAIHNIQQKSRFHYLDDGAFWEDQQGRDGGLAAFDWATTGYKFKHLKFKRAKGSKGPPSFC